MSWQKIPDKGALASLIDTTREKVDDFGDVWAPRSQFKTGTRYYTEVVYSTTPNNMSGDLIDEDIQFELPGGKIGAIYDDPVVEIEYNAFTAADAGDTIDWTVPIDRSEINQGGNNITRMFYRDYITSFKMGTPEYRQSLRDMNMFVDTKTGDQPAFTTTIPLLGVKNYGFSEDFNSSHMTIPVPGPEKLQFEFRLRNMFNIVPNGATTPDRPTVKKIRMFAMRRRYHKESDLIEDIEKFKTIGKSLKPVSVYYSNTNTSANFTSDANGAIANISMPLQGIESNYVAWLLIRLRKSSVPFDDLNEEPINFTGTGNYIAKNGSQFKQLYSSTAIKRQMFRNHRSRLPTSDYSVKTVKDNMMIVLSNESSIFELQNIVPDYYEPTCSPELILKELTGLDPTTNYTLDVSAVIVDGIYFRP